jgi:hypothetical protein
MSDTSKQSELLTQFYIDYLAWAEAGALDSEFEVFSARYGLCQSLTDWMLDKWLDHSSRMSLPYELKDQFSGAGLDRDYPFNTDDLEYELEHNNRLMVKNKKRIAWVRAHIIQTEVK